MIRLPTVLTHAAARHRQLCATLGADFWRVLAYPTHVVVARNGELALAVNQRRFNVLADGELRPIQTALRIGVVLWRRKPWMPPADVSQWPNHQLAAAAAWSH